LDAPRHPRCACAWVRAASTCEADLGRRLGQHFLARKSILQRIATAACAAPRLNASADASGDASGDAPIVIEIGPGRGSLTEELLAVAGKVIAIEIDPVLVHYLQQKFAETIAAAKLVLIEGDVLTTDLRSLAAHPVIAGNLPYYITSPILERIFTLGGAWERAVFLVQAEVAARIAAVPGTRDFGYLSVLAQVQTRVENLFDVPRDAFKPPPKVDSAVIRLTPRTLEVADLEGFIRFAQLCFRQKRKTLRNNLAAAYGKEIVDGLAEGKLRAEQLGVAELIALYEKLSGHAASRH
jgi:16S rRNA (adenine1518-N6/adenine1519-N6)-dimethyltransferase